MNLFSEKPVVLLSKNRKASGFLMSPCGAIFLSYKFPLLDREEKQEEPDVPKYRDRAKERREDQNPDYEPTELGSFHAVAPPGTVDLR